MERVVNLINIGYPNNKEREEMIYPSIDKLLNLVDSKYRLVHIVARRSEEIKKTNHLQKNKHDYISKKNIGKSLEEIAENLIVVKVD